MQLALAVLVVFVAQMVKGITGFGAALVAVPPLTVIYGPAEAILISSCCDVLSSAGLVAQVRAQIRWKMVLVMLLPLVIGLQVGATLLGFLPREALLLAMGLVVAGMGSRFLLNPVRAGVGELDDLPEEPGSFYYQAAVVGFLSGTMGAAVGTTGPPVVLWARTWLTDRFFRVQVIAILALAGLGLPITLVSRGLIPVEMLALLPYLLLPLVAGMFTGSRLAPRLSRVAFGRAVGAVLVGSGLLLLARAATFLAW